MQKILIGGAVAVIAIVTISFGIPAIAGNGAGVPPQGAEAPIDTAGTSGYVPNGGDNSAEPSAPEGTDTGDQQGISDQSQQPTASTTIPDGCTLVYVFRPDKPDQVYSVYQVRAPGVDTQEVSDCNPQSDQVAKVHEDDYTYQGREMRVPLVDVLMHGRAGGMFAVPTGSVDSMKIISNLSADGKGIFVGSVDPSWPTPNHEPAFVLHRVQ